MTATRTIPPEALDWTEWIRPGDTVLWGQGTGEPLTLTESLVAQRARVGPFTVLLSTTYSRTVRPEYRDGIRVVGIGAVGETRRLAAAGMMTYLPVRLAQLPTLLREGRLRVDVVLVQVSPRGPNRRHSFGLVADYVGLAMQQARTVIAEVNDQVPWTHSDIVEEERIAAWVPVSRPPLEMPPFSIGPVERAIAERVAAIVPDGATVEIGIGAVPAAILKALAARRDLGIHSGLLSDEIAELMQAGAVTNARKRRDQGVTVGGVLFGTKRLYAYAHCNPKIALRSLAYTHDVRIIGELDQFFAINGAVEVDLTGQVNAETVQGALVGAVGGQADFVRGAWASPGGRSIIALPATASQGRVSRIVPALSGPVTTPRSDADLVVTEYGVADLRGVPVEERPARLIAIAHPAFREMLRRSGL